MERYCSFVPNVLAFKTPTVGCFLVFGVSNAKYLTFGTLDGNALTFSQREGETATWGREKERDKLKI